MLLMPFAGFTPLSVFSLITCQLYCKAKHPWEDTVYKISPAWGIFLSSKTWQTLTQCSTGRFRNSSITGSWFIYICRLHWGKLHWMGREDVLRLNRVTQVQSYLPALPEHRECVTGQTYKDSGIWIWGDLPLVHGPPIQFPSPTLTLPLCFLKKKSSTHLTILNTAGQSTSTSLREKQSLTAQLCSASLSWKINQHIQVYLLLGGKILSPSTSRQSFNSKMKIPDTNHTAFTLPKWSMTQNMAQQISHVFCFTRVDF